MKRRVDESVKQEPARFEGDRVLGSPTSVVQTTFKVEQRESVVMPGSVAFTQQQSYAAMPGAANKTHSGSAGSAAGSSPMAGPGLSATQAQVQQFQRLKVEDALSYLDQVKFKFGNHPQVYNDFLDIMKEFKSQSIDTPGVIQRVSNLFKGHPELIVGFNTFLPPGYKIEVQANDQGYAFQVSVSMPSPTSSTQTSSLVHSGQHAVAHPAGHALAQGGGTTVHTIPIGGPPPSSGSKSMIILHGTQSSSTATPLPSSAPHAREAAPFSSGANANNVAAQSANHHQHSAAHHAIAAAHQALSHGGDGGPQQAQQSQPVEFNHAINYVNKIKNRFQGQPDKYKRFLEILHTYQKEQRNLKEGRPDAPGKHLTEAEVYAQVAKLFENQDDLLAEFGQFLPDATSHHGLGGGKGSSNDHSAIIKKSSSGVKSGYANSCSSAGRDATPSGGGGKFGHATGQVKRSPSFSGADHGPPPSKKQKPASLRDVSLAEAGKYGSLNDYAFFDKIRKGLKNQDVYENFLRCITIYNHEVVSRSELVLLVTPFLGKFPELFRWFKEFVGYTEMVMSQGQGHHLIEAVPNSVARADRPTGDLAMEIDYTTCKRLGASYCALPKTYDHLKCSGRTPLCREVLNDTWVSFPTWSEDSTFVTSRKTQYEEYIYRCEDERFELDVVIETNAATIRVLEGIQKKLQRLSPDEVNKFRLDDCLGGFSPTIHQRALKRVYGDKALDIIEGLKKNPLVAVPVVVRRLKAKEEEWREAQKGFNKVWRDQNEKYYLKSLDHQGINFKQTDVKALRSKSLFNEIETLFDERHEQAEESEGGPSGTGPGTSGPHLVLPYKDKSIIADAANLLIHHVKRQTGVQKEDKQRIKQLLRQFIPDLFFHTRQELSDDERDDDDEKEDIDMDTSANASAGGNGKCKTDPVKDEPTGTAQPAAGGDKEVKLEERTPSPTSNDLAGSHPDESYILFVANNHWYIFLRLHQILCDRLTRMLERAVVLTAEERKNSHDRKESTAIALRLKPKSEIAVEDYYPAFLDMVKNVLDGNMDSNAYEDTLREMFGIHAYHAFTLDKVVTYAVRQLQHLVSDETCQECVEMLHTERRRGGAGGPCATAHQRAALEAAYQRRAEQVLSDENSFRIVVFKHDCKMTIELLETEPEEPDAPAEVDKWSTYVERFAGGGLDAVGAANASARAAEDTRDDEDLLDMSGEEGDELDSVTGGGRRRKAVFLPRNVRLWKQRSGNESREFDDDQNWMKPAREDKDDADKEKEDISADDKDKEGRLKSTTDSDSEKAGGPENRLGEPVPGLIAEDNTQCKFSINSYRVSYVVSKENYMYKRRALPKAKETHPAVSLRLGGRFRRWHASWARSNVSAAQTAACADWLMGRGEDLVAHVTRLHDDNDVRRAPYRPYNRYRVTLQAATGGDAK